MDKVFLDKHDGLSSNPRHHIRDQERWNVSVTPTLVRWKGKQRDSWSCLASSDQTTVNSSFRERLCHKNEVESGR